MTKIIIANWKMNLSYRSGLELIGKYARSRRLKASKRQVVVCPDYLVMAEAAKKLKRTSLGLGAQDAAMAAAGAYTGEVSPASLKEAGVSYVIIGHSERREKLHESGAIIAAKLQAAIGAGLTPILCIGEKLLEKDNGETRQYLDQELRRALSGLKLPKSDRLIIAYEPIWAISTAKDARPIDPAEAGELHGHIRATAAKILKKKVRVIYGGSVNPVNAAAFLKQPSIGGLLVGAASLKLADFEAIC